MSLWVLFLIVAGASALLVAYAANRWAGPSHPTIDTRDLDLAPGLTVFTSTDCPDCAAVMALLRGRRIPIREVTHELEPRLFERAHVDGVPLIVGVDEAGTVVGQLAGLPRRRALDALIRSVS